MDHPHEDMKQNHVVLVDLLHMVAHPLPRLVQPLRVVDHRGLKITTIVEMAVQLSNILCRSGVVVEGERVLIRPVPSDGLVQESALVTVCTVMQVVHLLGTEIPLELLQEELAFSRKTLLLTR